MKKYAEVFWAPWVDNLQNESECWVNTAYFPPTPLLGLAHQSIQDDKNLLFKCPAVKSVLKNDFVIKAPIDLTLTFDQTTASIFTHNYYQKFFDKYVVNRSKPGGPVILSLPPRYIFFSKDDVEMLSLDLPLLSSESNKNIKMIPGKYNISKWLRPIDFTFTVIDPLQPVAVKAEDLLWAVRFYTPNDVPVKMTRFNLTENILKSSQSMMHIKKYREFLPLKKCYELAKGLIQQLNKKF